MDQQKLRTLVFEKTGVRIDVDDPVFALVALNEAVLAEAVERHVALLEQASAALADQVHALRGGSGAAPQPATAVPVPAGASAPGLRPAELRGMTIAGGAAVLGAVLVLGGQALFFRPAAPAPAPPTPSAISAEQQAALRDGEKLARIVRGLDAKTRNAIDAEMKKP